MVSRHALIARQEQEADGVLAGLRQLEAELFALRAKKRVRDLHQDAGAVAGARIGADRAAMLEIARGSCSASCDDLDATCGP